MCALPVLTNMDKLLKQTYLSNKLRCRFNIYEYIFVGVKNTLFRGRKPFFFL